MYPASNGEEVDLFAFNTELDEYMALNAQIKALKALKDEKANIIKEYMKEAGKGISERYRVSYKSSEKKTFDVDRFEAEHKDIDISEYYKYTITRSFKVTKKGDK